MQTPTDERKARFHAALALARMNVDQWAAEQGVSANHVYMVLRGSRTSQRLTDAIESFADETLSRAA
jgi:hypothetical protein